MQVVDFSTYSSFFSVANTNRFVVTEEIKNALIKNKISNIDFSKDYLCSEDEYKDWKKYNSNLDL